MKPQLAPTQRPAWVTWCFWGSMSFATLLLIATITCAILWWILPGWLHDLIIARSPWFPPIYFSCERTGRIVDGSASMPFAKRFDDLSVPFTFLTQRLEDDDPARRDYAAGFTGMLLANYDFDRKPAPSLDPAVRRALVDRLMMSLRSGIPNEQLSVTYPLCLLNPSEHLPEMLAFWSLMPRKEQDIVSYHLANIDDPRVCDLVLQWFRLQPSSYQVHALAHQSDERAAKTLLLILQSPAHPLISKVVNELCHQPPTNPALLSELKRYCLDADGMIATYARYALYKAPAGIPYLLELRCDPQVESGIHAEMERYLRKRQSEMTEEQLQRWLNAPVIPPEFTVSP
jgi:hypothetical protein